VEIEHEVGDGALEAGSLAVVDDEAGAGDFGGALEVQDTESLAEGYVVEWREGRAFGRVLTVAFDLVPDFGDEVGVLVRACGDGVLGQVGDVLEQRAELLVGCAGGGFEGFALGLEFGELGGERGGVGALALELAEVGGELVALGLEGLGLGDGVAAAGVDGGELAEDWAGSMLRARSFSSTRERFPRTKARSSI